MHSRPGVVQEAPAQKKVPKGVQKSVFRVTGQNVPHLLFAPTNEACLLMLLMIDVLLTRTRVFSFAWESKAWLGHAKVVLSIGYIAVRRI